ncbi:hypothetical protein GGI43DRAFT_411983 [Trichoderma evansii]
MSCSPSAEPDSAQSRLLFLFIIMYAPAQLRARSIDPGGEEPQVFFFLIIFVNSFFKNPSRWPKRVFRLTGDLHVTK